MLIHRTSKLPRSLILNHRAVLGIGIAIIALALVPIRSLAAPELQSARTLSFNQRVAAQRAIEQVYWNHRIWPEQNPGPKPPLSAVMSDAMIRRRVEDYLKKSNALEKWWKRPITAIELQAEMDRMAKDTRDPATLQELYRALGNDAFVVAETLARPTLAERLIHDSYSTDARFHGGMKAKAEAALLACRSVDCMKSMSGIYHEGTVKLRIDQAARKSESLPTGRLSALEETPDAFVVTAVIAQQNDQVAEAAVAWPKRSFDLWWGVERAAVSSRIVPPSETFALPNAPLAPCTNDSWIPTSSIPSPRLLHTAVWTGAELIVWGGYGGGSDLDTGARYNPTTDSWTPTSTGANLPIAREAHTAVWTGTQMIVWGGYGNGNRNSGGIYSPSTDSWTETSTGTSVPSPRSYHTAVWTGTEMIVWGGNGGTSLNTGGRYTPSTDSWTETSTGTNVPDARQYQTAEWTGTEMIVWGGGSGATRFNTGGRYNPSTDSWLSTSVGTNVPSARSLHSSVWTGSQLIVWGGYDVSGADVDTGGRYTPATDSWLATSTGANLPATRESHTAVWTGSELIVWGGYHFAGTYQPLNTGGRYNPTTNSWTATSTGANVPAERVAHTAAWTGSTMIVCGGDPLTATCGTYCACPAGRIVFRDADGDTYGNGGIAIASCDGSIPAGYVADGTDCDDTNPAIHPGAADPCNGVDDNCDGVADGSAPPGVLTTLTMTKLAAGSANLTWSALPDAQNYDTVRGSLNTLRSSAGNFTTSADSCIANNGAAPVTDASVPTAGTGFWYLVRAGNCAGAGSYNESVASQSGSRDAEIASSPFACP